MATTYNRDGSKKETKGDKKPFIERLFKLPYDTLDTYKQIKNKRSQEKKIIDKINQN